MSVRLAVYDYMDDSLAEAMDDMEKELIKVCGVCVYRVREWEESFKDAFGWVGWVGG